VLPAITASRNGRLVAIASRDRSRAEAFAAEHGALRVSPTYDAVLEDPEVEAVYIPLVNSLHQEWTLRALDAGKHVLCEKPLGVNAAQAEAMAAASARTGRHLMEAFMYRFHPRIREFVEGLRDPLYVQAGFGFPLNDPANVRLVPELGGGALLDVGCYAVSVARWILGEPDRVQAMARIDQVDMSVSVLLGFPNGAMASAWASFESPEEQRLTVVTLDETLRVEKPFSAWRDPDDPYQLMVESFADSISAGSPPEISLEESIANLRVLDRIRDAIG
jgi:xylose dehydrogenase (NAD/NADP)